MLTLPHCSPPKYPGGISPARFAATIRTDSPEGCSVAILGMPDDLGVRLNHGRPGAKEGPRAVRKALAAYGVAEPYGVELPRVFDAGDVEPAAGDGIEALVETHRRVSAVSEMLTKIGLVVIGLGGGHDLTYPLVRGVWKARQNRPMSGLYFDAHLDVRDTPGSGMAFRKLIEDKIASDLRIVGFSPLVNQSTHVEWFMKNRGAIHPAERPALEGLNMRGGFVSVDLDCVHMGSAPGVSAPNPGGLTAVQVAADLFMLGRNHEPACLDFMELCPAHDDGGRTARLEAHFILNFLFGMGMRKTATG